VHEEIRRVTPADAESVAVTLKKAFLEYQALYTPEAFAATVPGPKGVAERLQQGPAWVAVRGVVVLGTISAVVGEEGIHVRGMAVIPQARERGIGTKLLQCVETLAREKKSRRLFLSTTPFLDDAIRLYERFGFRRTDEGPFDLCGTPLYTMEKRFGAS
jgi:ribosomal protein S18 acetylase RimI-like enzyme